MPQWSCGQANIPPRWKAIWICSSMDASSVGLNSTCDMHQGYRRFKATANKFPVSMNRIHLSMSIFHGYNFTEINRNFQSLPIVSSERPKLNYTHYIVLYPTLFMFQRTPHVYIEGAEKATASRREIPMLLLSTWFL